MNGPIQATLNEVSSPSRSRSRLESLIERITAILESDRLPYFQIVIISAILLSCVSAYLFVTHGLHIAHFDAKGHLLVPRRLFDNLSPGFKQIGAFWLPLPHWIYLPFVIPDQLYFSGTAVLPVTMTCFVLTVALLFKIIQRIIGSFPAFCGSTLYATNPNMLYLQTTPLTENLSLLFFLGSVFFFIRYAEDRCRKSLLFASLLGATGILTRYENWFVFAAMGTTLLVLHAMRWVGWKRLITDSFLFGISGALAAGFSFWLNWYTTGHAYMDHRFKHTDFQPAEGSWMLSFFVILYTVGNLISYEWTLVALAGAVFLVRKKWRDPAFLASLTMLAPFVLYLYEYFDNHPTRIRYGIPFVPGFMFLASYWPGRSRLLTYLFVVFAVYVGIASPFYRVGSSQLLKESMRDADNLALQHDLLWYFSKHDDGRLVLAAMGEIAPVLYDLKIPVRRLVHEGAKPYWNNARKHPEKVVGWVFMSQDDHLWKLFHDDPEFHKHFALIGRSGFLELYRRTPDEEHNRKSHKPHPTEDKHSLRNLPVI